MSNDARWPGGVGLNPWMRKSHYPRLRASAKAREYRREMAVMAANRRERK
jgi:hypothetical protein